MSSGSSASVRVGNSFRLSSVNMDKVRRVVVKLMEVLRNKTSSLDESFAVALCMVAFIEVHAGCSVREEDFVRLYKWVAENLVARYPSSACV